MLQSLEEEPIHDSKRVLLLRLRLSKDKTLISPRWIHTLLSVDAVYTEDSQTMLIRIGC